jgi:hypothetical protein
VFAALIDIGRLPEWNARVHHVIENPTSELTVTWAVCPRTWDDGYSALASAGAR